MLLSARLAILFIPLLNFLMIACYTLPAQAQNEQPVTMWTVEAGAGFIIPHSTAIAAISGYRPMSMQVSWSRIGTSRKSWEQCYCSPNVGVTAFHHRYGNAELLGSGTGLLAFIHPLFSMQRKVGYGLKLAGGPVYLNRVYDPVSNPDNLFFSSTLSVLLAGSAELRYSIRNNVHLHMAAAYMHISNGGLKEPNKGMNYPTLLVGVSHLLTDESLPSYPKQRTWQNNRPVSYTLSALYSSRLTGVLTDRRLHLHGLEASLNWRHGMLGEFRSGIEYVYDPKRALVATRVSRSLNANHAGLHVGEYLIAGRFALGAALGIYIWEPDPFKDFFYQRYTLSLELTKHVRAAISLRAHRSIADFADVRLGFVF